MAQKQRLQGPPVGWTLGAGEARFSASLEGKNTHVKATIISYAPKYLRFHKDYLTKKGFHTLFISTGGHNLSEN